MKTVLFWIDGPWRGKLAISARPRGGDWLESEVQSWKEAGIRVVVSALTKDEIEDLDLAREADLCKASGLDFIAFPVEDRGVPASVGATVELVRQLENKLAAGEKVAIHCRQGVGRSAVLAASFLVAAGEDSAVAFDRIAVARGCGVPDTAEQREWLAKFGRVLQATRPE